MRGIRRRLLVLAVAVATVVALLWDPLGLLDGVRASLAVPPSAEGSAATTLEAVARRQARVARRQAVLALDPLLSAATLAVGLGTGLVLGGVGTFLYQRRRIRRGDWDG